MSKEVQTMMSSPTEIAYLNELELAKSSPMGKNPA